MTIRPVSPADAAALVTLFYRLDEETTWMLFEPGERQLTVAQQSEHIAAFTGSRQQVMFVAEAEDNQIAGFVVGIGGHANRNRHAMYCVIGVRQSHQGKGIGRKLLSALESWAESHAFHRLELTVMALNTVARQLYQSAGFQEEGIKRDAMRVDGAFIDEIYMAKLLRAS
ncbi:GNAT family N-acetyltransferase [Photobacterium galatheae]|uniref:GCN5 family acetyltransferase n=1 Tax=Photobacterium galatheae TaxID=1654360 RepID=A0A066RY37_9GAMM|nr:GNAT family protein [Photobacterium galatheae]KDM92293.1 GCN5 family acetyltransferase [Photobacterium galatheae]MCM0150526.1 GNAT family N-acetyltransferase [Photobacterium galatheae]